MVNSAGERDRGMVQKTSSSNAAVGQLFARIQQEVEEKKPSNCIHFIVDFLCRHYPEHLHGFASIWQADPDLERERHEVVNFFKTHKISTAVAAHFTNAGFDTLDTLTTLNPDALVDVEAFNNVKWLPGHKVRLQQIFSEISARIRAYKQQHMIGAPTYSAPTYTVAHDSVPMTAHHASYSYPAQSVSVPQSIVQPSPQQQYQLRAPSLGTPQGLSAPQGVPLGYPAAQQQRPPTYAA